MFSFAIAMIVFLRSGLPRRSFSEDGSIEEINKMSVDVRVGPWLNINHFKAVSLVDFTAGIFNKGSSELKSCFFATDTHRLTQTIIDRLDR